jgi:hypothetical protein
MALLVVAAPVQAQISSQAASVTLHARVEESVSVKAYSISVAQPPGHGGRLNPVALHVLLNWRLQGARVYRVGYGLQADDEPLPEAEHREFFSLRELEAKAAAFCLLPASGDRPTVLGVWGNTDQDPSGMASLLLTVPFSDADAAATLRITLAVF